jgi:hypothetical protein
MSTPYDLYQTYLRGPVAIIRLFEQTFGTLHSPAHRNLTNNSGPSKLRPQRLTAS